MSLHTVSCAVAAAATLVVTSVAKPPTIGERPAVEQHLAGDGTDARLNDLIDHGERLFTARFNRLDGQGRPGSTGTGEPREPDEPAFVRTSSPEANSCSGCHAQPGPGGAGDFVANVFVLAQALDPVTFSVHADFSNERNTLGMFGAGPIEMLAREMTAELHAIRDDAMQEAELTGKPATRALTAKLVSFGTLTCMPDGTIDPTGIEGVDWDLVIKPFHQKGAVVSIREFTNNALNHHHGIQSVERFGAGVDADLDGVSDELTVGDVTAMAVFQAALGTPQRVRPTDRHRRDAAERGETLFAQIGCTECHIPVMVLENRFFTEPNPYNPAGNLHPDEVNEPFSFDMTRKGTGPRLGRLPDGRALVEAYTDLKRHDLNDDELDHFANERLAQGTLNGFAPASDFIIDPEDRPTTAFLTRKLWDVGNSDPYGHRGDLTTMTEAIHFHGGEARATRDAFFALTETDRNAIIEFLKTLRVEE
jgi:cytochrome c peroxidase